MNKLTPTTLFWIALAGTAGAQQSGDEEEELGFSGKAAVGYIATSGNTESTNANASLELHYEQPIWAHESRLAAVSATRDDVTTAEAYSTSYEARRSWGERNYLFTTVDWRSDRFSAFDRQLSETIGYGRRLVSTDRHELSVEGGLGARQAERRGGLEEDDQIARLTLEYDLTVNDTTSFAQNLVTESGDFTSVESVSELRARLFGNIALVISHRVRYHTDVDPGTESTDQFTSLALEYAF